MSDGGSSLELPHPCNGITFELVATRSRLCFSPTEPQTGTGH
jgi:hypothetical protein